jgi:hypothetical protein
VILDENGVRVKDITLKKVVSSPFSFETAQNLINQLQMQQLFEKLDSIQELQRLQIDMIRNNSIIVPFMNARDHILSAQNLALDELRQKEYLTMARNELTTAVNALYADIETMTKRIRPSRGIGSFFPHPNQMKNRQECIGYLAWDIRYIIKFVGLKTQILSCLDEFQSATAEMERYQRFLHDFFVAEKPFGKKMLSTADQVHQYFSYTGENRDYWHNWAVEVKKICEEALLTEGKNIIMIGVEDNHDADPE